MTPSTSHAEKVREKQDSTKNGLTTAVGNDVKGGERKSEEIHSKDALEEKLEKILFGDDMGFHLSDHEEQEKELEPKTDYVANESDAESMDFANMNDEDVCSCATNLFNNMGDTDRIFSCSLLIRDQKMHQQRKLKLNMCPLKDKIKKNSRLTLLGRTAMRSE